jgi:hypothetical protein
MTTAWSRRVGLAVLGAVLAAGAARADFVNEVVIPGDTTDLGGGVGANQNRFGGFSDLYYDRLNNVYYGLPDRGPGGGLISYETRVHQFTLDVDPATGGIGNFRLTRTIKFKTADGSAAFNGLNPRLLNGDPSVLGRSFDPEGFVKLANGNFVVSDEYGPSVYEFRPVRVGDEVEARFVRAFAVPDNLLPRQADGALNFVDGRGTIATGRQDNRGFEGLTVSPDGRKVYAALQDPLVNEGSMDDGRRSRNVRIVEFDAATGQSTAQYVYRLENRDDINARVPGAPFGATQQGRNIGIGAIVALNDHEFLVLERDNRGVGVENAADGDPVLSQVGTKRVYRVDLTGATDVSGISLAGANALPPGVTAVSKTLVLDIQAALEAAGLAVPEKIEGLAVGPLLLDGRYALLLGTDNDFSVTQTGAGEQFDVYTDGVSVRFTPLDDRSRSFDAIGGPDLGPLPAGFALLPSVLYSFAEDVPGFVPQAVPEPASLGLLAAGAAAGLVVRARRRR